jgi:hypothetical protein
MFAVNEGDAACSRSSAKAAGTAGKEQGGSRRGGGKGRSKGTLGIDDNSTTRWHQVLNPKPYTDYGSSPALVSNV